MESTPNASVGDNGSGVAKKKARSQIKTYVPPHMRRKTSAESSENRDNNNAAVLTTAFCPSKGVEQTEQAVDASRKGKSNTHGKKEDVSWSTFSYKASKIDKETGDDSTMPAPVIISPKAMKSSVLISGFGEMNDEAKNGILQPYVKAGGRAQWITNSEAIVVFPNETACEGAMKLVKNCFIKIEVVDNLNRHQNQQIRNGKLH